MLNTAHTVPQTLMSEYIIERIFCIILYYYPFVCHSTHTVLSAAHHVEVCKVSSDKAVSIHNE